MKKKRKINIISIIIYSLLLLVSIVLFGIITYLSIVPLKFWLPVLIIYGLILIGMGIITFKKNFRSWLKILIDIVSAVLIIGLIIIYYYLNTTLNFMGKIKAGKYQIEEYYVIVNTSSEYQSLKDLENDTIGDYDSSLESYNKALEELKDEINIKTKKYDNYIEASEALIDKKIDALLLSAASKTVVEDIIPDFDSKIKILHTIEVKTLNNIDTSSVNVTKEPFNIYVSGIDIYGNIASVSRSDVNMIITVNPTTHKILLTSIPRDYYVKLHGTTGTRDKLTHAGMYGINMSIETIEDLLDVEIDYYVRVNFTTLINLVDAIDGIEVYSDKAFTAYTDRSCRYKVGTMKLNGKCALAYARERYAYTEGDRHRVQNQQDVIKAIINKALSSRTLITKYSKILDSMGSSFQMNIPSENIYDLINMQLDKMPSWNIESYSLNGFDKHAPTYSSGSEQLYVMEPDLKTVEEAKIKIDTVIAG